MNGLLLYMCVVYCHVNIYDNIETYTGIIKTAEWICLTFYLFFVYLQISSDGRHRMRWHESKRRRRREINLENNAVQFCYPFGYYWLYHLHHNNKFHKWNLSVQLSSSSNVGWCKCAINIVWFFKLQQKIFFPVFHLYDWGDSVLFEWKCFYQKF